MKALGKRFGLLLALLGGVSYAAVLPSLYARPRPPLSPEMEVAMPRFVQVLMAAGDRYLAANLDVFRALLVSTDTMSAANYRILAIVQRDAAWLNPAQEDNYYLAAAILPWAGEVAAAQYILRLATEARPFDPGPPFFYAFNELHFFKDPVEGANWLLLASSHTQDTLERLQLQQMAALWLSKGEDIQLSIRLLRKMAQESGHKAFARFLGKRADRLENLLALDRAIARYRELVGEAPSQLEQLVDRALLPAIPEDPFAMEYFIDGSGKAQLAEPAAAGSGRAP